MNPKIVRLITDYQKENKEEALLELWACFQPLVINTMRKFYVLPCDQDDVAQDAFLQLLKCANEYDLAKGVPFESYYKMQLQYWFLNKIRKKTETLAVDHNWSMGVSMTDLVESTMGNAQEMTELKEAQAQLDQVLASLTLKQRQAVTLFYLEGISLKNIAKKMNCSYKVAFKHKAAGLKKIEKHYRP